MKGDFTRSTFKKKKHFHDVRMQQGRVQLDADWNEQLDITSHRVETETKDVVGLCGTPMHHGGFHIVVDPDDLTGEEKALPENDDYALLDVLSDNFYISGGRIYVDGILCENEHIVPFTTQPDLPENTKVVTLSDGTTASVPTKGTYLAYIDVWLRHITALEDDYIREKALGEPDTATRTKTVWQVKLYPVEIKNPNCLDVLPGWKESIAPVTGMLSAKTEEAGEEEKPCVLSPEGGYRRLENQLYRVEIHRGGKLSNLKKDFITIKWSRDNGSIVTKWEEQDGDKLTVSSTGRDKVLNFAKGQWVELTDDTRELLGKPGTLVQLKEVEGRVLTIDTGTINDPDNPGAASVNIKKFPENPKIRRWDSKGTKGEITVNITEKWLELEDGVWVEFSTGTYKTGDYWLIPARTVDADVEWPLDDSDNPVFQPPHGIHHHYCPLALLEFKPGKSPWKVLSDCRRKFPPVTELTSLYYVSGDGQEAMPNNTLANELQVRVANGQIPVIGAKVRFTVLSGSGALSSGASAVTTTPDDGIAACPWKLGPDGSGSQQVSAELLDTAGHPVPGQIVYFNANLSVAENVYYNPKGCVSLSSVDNVQDALERLSKLTTISYVGGYGQDGVPGEWLPKPLEVRVVSKCGPVAKAKVTFTAEGGGLVAEDMSGVSTATGTVQVNTDPDGKASCVWLPEDNTDKPVQELTAVLDEVGTDLVQEPKSLRFTANLRLREGSGCCTVTVGENGDYNDIREAVGALDGGPGTVCILPGIYMIDEPVSIMNGWDITILGCSGKSIIINNAASSTNGTVFIIKDSGHINIKNLWAVTIKGSRVIDSLNSRFVNITDCMLIAAGFSDIPGVVVFQGGAIGCALEKNLLGGIVGLRFGVSATAQEQHMGIIMGKNTVFALESAVSQESAALLSGFNVVDNLLLGFGVNSLLNKYFPTAYLNYAKKNSMYDKDKIEQAEKIHAGNPGFESITASDISPLLGFVNHLRSEKWTERLKKKFELSKAETTAPVIDLRRGCLDSNFYNNILLGKSGIHAASVIESSLEKNMIFVFHTGISLGTFEGVTIDDNLVVCEIACILCNGKSSMNLTVSNNRLIASNQNIAFEITHGNTSNLVTNAQISRNYMDKSKVGIQISNPAVWVYDLSVFDNSISCSDCGIRLYGFDVAPLMERDVSSFQRVIQRNSIQTGGMGIVSTLANVKTIDNDIAIASKSTFSTGILFSGENCTIANNTISAFVDIENGYISQGGISISPPFLDSYFTQTKKFKIESNHISGGMGNGISIYSYTDNGVIVNNFIADMSMNGIAAQDGILSKNLTVSNNTITNCCSLNGVQEEDHWWKYAGIVLYQGKNIQIMGNKILGNGRKLSANSRFQVGGFYADKLETAAIADNQFIDNGVADSMLDMSQAIIHILGGIDPEFNKDVKIVSNTVKGSSACALLLGINVECNYFGLYSICSALDRNTVITNNHFESMLTPAVKLQTNYCTFSNNFVECPDIKEPDGSLRSSVDLGVGWFVIAIGNVLSAPIHGTALSLVLTPNVTF